MQNQTKTKATGTKPPGNNMITLATGAPQKEGPAPVQMPHFKLAWVLVHALLLIRQHARKQRNFAEIEALADLFHNQPLYLLRATHSAEAGEREVEMLLEVAQLKQPDLVGWLRLMLDSGGKIGAQINNTRPLEVVSAKALLRALAQQRKRAEASTRHGHGKSSKRTVHAPLQGSDAKQTAR